MHMSAGALGDNGHSLMRTIALIKTLLKHRLADCRGVEPVPMPVATSRLSAASPHNLRPPSALPLVDCGINLIHRGGLAAEFPPVSRSSERMPRNSCARHAHSSRTSCAPRSLSMPTRAIASRSPVSLSHNSEQRNKKRSPGDKITARFMRCRKKLASHQWPQPGLKPLPPDPFRHQDSAIAPSQ
jgi:hypothetical protein